MRPISEMERFINLSPNDGRWMAFGKAYAGF